MFCEVWTKFRSMKLALLVLIMANSASASHGWRTELRARCLDIALKKAESLANHSDSWKPDLKNPIVKEVGDKKSCDVTFSPVFKNGEQGLGGGFVIHVNTVDKTSTVRFFQ